MFVDREAKVGTKLEEMRGAGWQEEELREASSEYRAVSSGIRSALFPELQVYDA